MMSMERGKNSMPGGWRQINVNDQPIFIHENSKIAMTHKQEISKKKPKRTTKVSAESGTYVIQPQPKDLPPDWERAVAINPDGSTGVFVYHNVKSGQTSMQMPSPTVSGSKDEGETPLPAGWVVGYDEEGDVYFEDKNSGIITYDDPRLVSKYVRSSNVEQIASQQLRARTSEEEMERMLREQKMARRRASKKGSSISLTSNHSACSVVDDEEHAELSEGIGEDEADGADDAWVIGRIDLSRFNSLPQHLTPKTKLPAEITTKAMNRYTNILPNPRTRVRLEDDHAPQTTISMYINANYVPGYNMEPRMYVAAMGPLDATIEAFWRMVWMVEAPSIIMTTPMAEKGVVKCARYWPTVRYNEQKKCGDKRWGDFRVAVLKGQKRKGYIITHLRVTKGDEERHIRHYWFTDWPDHGVPQSASNVINMLADARSFSETESTLKGPMVVHCSAGIGRTGTFIAIDHCIRQLEESGRTEPLEVVGTLRRARGGMVQHPQQYEFVQRACMEYSMNRGKTVKFLEGPPSSDSGSESSPGDEKKEKKKKEKKKKDTNWKNSIKSKKPAVWEELIEGGKPDDMPDEEWQRLVRRYCKTQSTIRAKHSIRRKFDPAELDGELRLGTLSGGTAMMGSRPSAKSLFEDQ